MFCLLLLVSYSEFESKEGPPQSYESTRTLNPNFMLSPSFFPMLTDVHQQLKDFSKLSLRCTEEEVGYLELKMQELRDGKLDQQQYA